MDSDTCPADQLPSVSSDSLCVATVPANEASGVEVTTQTLAAPPQVEDLESYNMIEPPPLDWRSDSSSEVGSADNLDDPSFPPSVEHLDKASPREPVLLPLEMSDTSFNIQQEAVSSTVEPVLDIRMKLEEDEAVHEEVGVEDLEGGGEYKEEVTLCHQKSRVSEEEVEGANKKSADEDHNSIHSLLSQLQLMEEEPHPIQLTPPHPVQHQYSGLSELESCTPSLITDNSTETTGLLFSESHHQDLLGLLQFTEIGVNPQPSPLPHRGGEVDAVVSVSYSQEDAQRFWGRCGNGQQQHRESLSSLPDDEYPEPVWKKRATEPPKEDEAATETEEVGRGAS